MSKTLVIASNNTHKVNEIKDILSGLDWQVQSMKEAGLDLDPEENAPDFVGNARIKARAVHEACGLAALADDSGLMVDALDGAPGVLSARWAGVHGDDAANNSKLLSELADIPAEKRSARFVCTLVFIDESGQELIAQGSLKGHIAFEMQGDAGFGYDPLFLPDCFGGSKTLAQVSPEEKNAISHRGCALVKLKELLS